MNYLLTTLFALQFINISFANVLTFTECETGSSKIVELRSTTCKTDPCEFIKGESAQIELDFIPDDSYDNITLTATASAFFMEIDIPVQEPYPCGQYIECPLKKDVINTLNYNFFIEDTYPSISATMKIYLKSVENTVACLQLDVALVDSPIAHQEL